MSVTEPTDGRAAPGLSPETLETAQLLLELVHLAPAGVSAVPGVHGSRQATSADAAHGPLSSHAVRAAIHVHVNRQRTVGELSRGLRISYGWASRVVAELEAAALVRRVPDPSDRRVQRVEMRPDALARLEAAYRWHADAVERALEPLDAEGRQQVQEFLRRVLDALRAPGPVDPVASGPRGDAASRIG